jgi:ATP-binding cassette subfamily B protein
MLIKKILKSYRYILPFWKKEVLSLALGILVMGVGLINPYLTKLIIDKAFANRDLGLFIMLAAIIGVVFILAAIINALNSYLSHYIKIRLTFELNRKAFQKLQSLSYEFFQENSTGENLFKLGYDIEQLSCFITSFLPQLIVLIPKTLLILAIIFYLNWKVALFALAIMLLMCVLPTYIMKRLQEQLGILIEKSESLFANVEEVLSRMQLIKAFGKEKTETKNYIGSVIKIIRIRLKIIRLEIGSSFMHNLMNSLTVRSLIFYCGYQLIKGRLTLGTFGAMAMYLNQLSEINNGFANLFQEVPHCIISYDRLERILEMQPAKIENACSQDVIFSRGNIEFRNVTFCYKKDKMILENLSFSVPAGSFVAFAGPSGVGKTTMVNLLLRLFRPLDGRVLIDGVDINNIKSNSFYRQIGVALQWPLLWNNSIENNIKYSNKEAGINEIREVARISCIDDFVNTLPQGYSTVIGEGACRLSHGQRQRIAIARALIKRPKILILDEALSSVDSENESKIIKNIKEAFEGVTIIIISHRLSTVMTAELVYFMQNSREIISAAPQLLLDTNEVFYNLFSAQTKEVCVGGPDEI